MKKQLELFPKQKLTLADIKEIVRRNAPQFYVAHYGQETK